MDLREQAQLADEVMAGVWTHLPPELLRWRQDLPNCVLGFDGPAVFCHFIAINVVVGAATGVEESILVSTG